MGPAGREKDGASAHKIAWREWSDEAFGEAEKAGRLVLLDLTATWCHWCHVMDGTTYSDDEVARLVNENFVPVRVDIDLRPDISERYNRGGFPTTAFLSSKGEPVWGATYIPPADMKRVVGSILKAKRTGEIDEALGRVRTHPLGPPAPAPGRGLPSEGELRALFEGVLGAYDVEHGGFGTEPKFPNPDAVDLLISRHMHTGDTILSDAVRHTLKGMARGLYDGVEGGVFRYSVSRDWSVPHYEKMLETNAGYLRNLARAHVAIEWEESAELAEGVAGYILKRLTDPATGAFYGSQDADESYYGLPMRSRAKRAAPAVDRTVYSGWNALTSSALTEAGVLLGRPDLTAAGLRALDRLMGTHWDAAAGLVRHSAGQDLFLSEDQVELLGSLLAAMELRGAADLGQTAVRLAERTRDAFAHPDGGLGDVPAGAGGIGSLARPTRSLVTNAKWAHRLALVGAAAGRADLVGEAGAALGSFDRETVEAHGAFAAPYIAAAEVLRAGPLKVEVHASRGAPDGNDLWLASKRALEPMVFTSFVADGDDFAVVCSLTGCSARVRTAAELGRALRHGATGQV